jgi:Flp pilus assembly protein TadG
MRLTSVRRVLLPFAESRSGNVAIIFGLAFVPLMLMIGVGIDYGRLVATRGNLQQATDAAVLAVAKSLTSTTTNQQAQSQAQVYLLTNVRNAVATVTQADIATNRLTLCIDTQAQIPTTIMKIARFTTMSTQTSACAQIPGGLSPTDTYEIALVLDNSGSMTRSTGGVSKMDALKTAATSFVATMFDKASGRVQFAITPFSFGVIPIDPSNITSCTDTDAPSWIDLGGASSQHWIAFGNDKSAASTLGIKCRLDIFSKLSSMSRRWKWGGCFEPQPYPKNVTETVPSSSDPDSLFVPLLSPDEPDNNRSRPDYSMDYLPDDGGSCSGSASSDWASLSRICKYNVTRSSDANRSSYGPNGLCPSYSTQTIMQLTSTKSTVDTKLSDLDAGGDTNLHDGIMWGWRTLSPNAPFAAGRAYDTSNSATNHKIIVFMTDGYNNWSSSSGTVGGSIYEAPGYYSNGGTANARLPDGTGTGGDGVNYQTSLAVAGPSSNTNYQTTARNALDELTLESCTNAKAAGIIVYTIGFSISTDPIDAQGLTLLQNCATDINHYFAATDIASLNAAFSSIGTGLGKLRLSR